MALTIGRAAAATDFTATGTGAKTRRVSDKLADAVSIRDFGARGDGLADDTAAIQNALAAHDNVFIPPGDYLLTATI